MKLSANKSLLLVLNLIILSSGQKLFAQQCKGEVSVNTNAANSLIFINDLLYGKGNVNAKLEKGTYNLIIKEDVFKWNPEMFDTTFSISNCDEVIKITHYFNSKETNSSLSDQKIIYKNGNGNGSFMNSTLFKTLIGTAVIFGGTSAYYKHKANENYDLYTTTGKQSYLDKTHKYDWVSGFALGALQINFGVLLYYFLTE